VAQHLAYTRFQNRLFLATGAIAGTVLLMVAIGVQALSSQQSHSRYAGLLARSIEAIAALEVEIQGALSQPTPESAAAAASQHRTALGLLSSLRAAGATEDSPGDPRWSALGARYGVDPAAERDRLGLGANAMPDAAQTVWRAAESGQTPLEESAAAFLTMLDPVVAANGVYDSVHHRLLAAATKLSQTQLLPGLRRMLLGVGEEAQRSASFSLAMLMVCAAILVLATALAAIFVLLPLRRAIAADSRSPFDRREHDRAAKRQKRELLSLMGHELRTAMNGIIGFSHLLLETQLDSKQRDYAQIVQQSGETLLELLNDILDLSEIEAGSLRLTSTDFATAEIVGDALAQLGPHAAAKRLELTAYVDPTLPEKLRGDGERIRQILVNLVAHAVKTTASGGIGVELRSESEGASEAGHGIVLTVSDTGAGVTRVRHDDHLANFHEGEGGSSRGFEGTDLGLALCRELTRMMGGTMDLESAPGSGNSFSVRLHLASARPAAAPLALPGQRSSLSGRRFLVVEDNPMTGRILRLQLESYGGEVECVADAQAALAALARGDDRRCPYDLAIIDQTLPEIDGLMLRKMIRDEPRHAGLKLIISSAGGIAFDQQARALGFDAACPKPITQAALLAKVGELLLPRSPADTTEIAMLSAKAATGQAVRGKQPRLLVAEDNVVNQQLITAALKPTGFLVDIVGDGVEAVHAVQRQHYDLVLMDIRMPVMNGVEATERIRALAGPASKLPIIAMTANAMAGDREDYLRAGMDDYVAKPVDFDILLAKIRAHLPGGAVDGHGDVSETVSWNPEKKLG
jgi:CheY-like chemotaxis protein/signal transduction histidine kinase